MTKSEDQIEDKSAEEPTVEKYEWMIKPCMMYEDEYKDCKSIKARFHQYFIHGEPIDCSQWHTDYKNCCLWESNKNREAFDQLINSEKMRRLERLKGHYQNNVWEKRDTPPENWNAPLPKWAEDKIATSQLRLIKVKMQKSAELLKAQESYCTIM